MTVRPFVPMLAAIVVLGATCVSAAGDAVTVITGGVSAYAVAAGDTLTGIAARFGVYPSTIAEDNGLQAARPLEVGRQLRIDNRHIAPRTIARGEIVVNVPQRMAFFEDGERLLAYPIAVGRPTWQTPTGSFTVVRKERDPAWHVPASIRAESARAGHPLPRVVPPGRRNPLGHFWIGSSLAGIGMHGTPVQSSIYQAATHGCLRLQRHAIADLYARVELGTRGRVLYEPILLAASGDEVYIEAHPDVYRRLPVTLHQEARALAAHLGLDRRIDWARADREIDRRAGVARRVEASADKARD